MSINNVESIGYTPIRKRNNKIQNNIESILTENHNLINEKRDNLFLESTMKRDLSVGSTRSISEIGKSAKQNEKVYNESKLEIFMIAEAFADIVIKSIPLDKTFIESCKNDISQKASKTFSELYNKGLIQEGNHIWKNYYDHIQEATPLLKENANDLDAVEQILTETENNMKEIGTQIADIIETKILETIKIEKILAENKTELMKANKRFSGSTLFNAINIKNIKSISKNDKFVDVSMDKMVSASFTESIIDYAILETLNTLNLIKFSSNAMVNIIKHA